ncbi:MAG: ankyrin repeat domain-containing protein [Chryseolinea sp.]
MNSYLDWVETATSLSIQSSFTLNTTYEYGGESLLHLAVKSGHVSMIKLLTEKGASIDIQDESGNTALHYAAANGKKDAVKYLLEKGADPAVVNVKEQKAVDYSNIKGFNEITALLLQKGPASKISSDLNT